MVRKLPRGGQSYGVLAVGLEGRVLRIAAWKYEKKCGCEIGFHCSTWRFTIVLSSAPGKGAKASSTADSWRGCQGT